MYGPKIEVSSSLSLRGCHNVLSAVAPIRPPNRLPALRPPGQSASGWGLSGQAGVSFWCLDFVDSHYWSFSVKYHFLFSICLPWLVQAALSFLSLVRLTFFVTYGTKMFLWWVWGLRCVVWCMHGEEKKDTKKKYKIEKISAMRCRGLFSDTS